MSARQPTLARGVDMHEYEHKRFDRAVDGPGAYKRVTNGGLIGERWSARRSSDLLGREARCDVWMKRPM